MLKGVLLAVILLIAGDVAFNRGRYVRLAGTKVAHLAAASDDAVQHSIFGG